MSLAKICGIRDLDSADVAVAHGASLIGFVFVPVRREVSRDVAKSIIASIRERHVAPPAAVGLFVNETAETINATVSETGLDLVQLHGDEPPEIALEIDVPVLKALRLESGANRDQTLMTVERYLQTCPAIHLDSHVPGQWGGTGVVGDWELAAEIAEQYPVILAGGLDPENVQSAIATVRPGVVDVSSGVETDGSKDAAKIEAFLAAANIASERHEVQEASGPLLELISSIRDRRSSTASGSRHGIN